MIYTKKELDDYFVRLTDALEKYLSENEESSNIKLKDFKKSKEIYGFYGSYVNTDLFTVRLQIPSCRDKVEDVKNIFIEIELDQKSNTDILTNYEKRKDFVKFLYHNYESEFKQDESNGKWDYTKHVHHQSSIKILKRFYAKKTGLPPVDDVVNSFKILANLDIPAVLKKWQELNK